MRPIHFRIASALLWLALVGAAFTAPPAAPDGARLIVKLATADLAGVNLSLFALFNLMGVWPMAMAVALRFDQPWWKWLFLAASFGGGAFALLPYFVLRPWLELRREPTSFAGRLLSSRWVLRALVLAALCFGALFLFGGLGEFATLFDTQQFPRVMSLDFVAFCIAGLLLVTERGVSGAGVSPATHRTP